MIGGCRALLAALALVGCAPLTFSHDPAVDFEHYRSVCVAPVSSAVHAGYADVYLARQLAESSGFEHVTLAEGRCDLILDVEISVHQEITVDDDGDTDVDYSAVASFVAITPGGRVVDAGSVDATSESSLEAVEDALDWVAHHYLRPYRA